MCLAAPRGYRNRRLRNDHGHGETLPPDFLPKSLTERAREFGGSVEVTHELRSSSSRDTMPFSTSSVARLVSVRS